jgi:hypothetical protein
MSYALGLLLYAVVLLVIAYVLYFVIRKGVAHGIRDARRAEEKAALEASDRL